MKKELFLWLFGALVLTATLLLCRLRPPAEQANPGEAKRKILQRWTDNMRKEFFAGHFRETELIAEKIILNFPDDPVACRMRTKICFLLGKGKEGEAISRKFLLHFPEDPGLMNNLAVILFAKRENAEALTLFSLGCYYAPENSVLIHNSRAASRLLGKRVSVTSLPPAEAKEEEFPEWLQIRIVEAPPPSAQTFERKRFPVRFPVAQAGFTGPLERSANE